MFARVEKSERLHIAALKKTDGAQKAKNTLTIWPNNSTSRNPKELKEEFNLPTQPMLITLLFTKSKRWKQSNLSKMTALGKYSLKSLGLKWIKSDICYNTAQSWKHSE